MGDRDGYLNKEDLNPAHTPLMIARYDEEIAYTDSELSTLFAYLKDSGLTENTMVMLFSDHGEEFYDHGGLAHQKTLYREQLHVPLIIRMPGDTPPQGRVARTVSQLDFFATVVEALNLSYTPPATSFSLMPFLTPNGEENKYARQYAPSHLDKETMMMLSIQNAAHKYILHTQLSDATSSISKDWRKIRTLHNTTFESRLIEAANARGTGGEEAVYKLPEDVLEQNNQASVNPEITKMMRSLMQESLKAAEKTLPEAQGTPEPDAPLSDAERNALEALGYLQ